MPTRAGKGDDWGKAATTARSAQRHHQRQSDRIRPAEMRVHEPLRNHGESDDHRRERLSRLRRQRQPDPRTAAPSNSAHRRMSMAMFRFRQSGILHPWVPFSSKPSALIRRQFGDPEPPSAAAARHGLRYPWSRVICWRRTAPARSRSGGAAAATIWSGAISRYSTQYRNDGGLLQHSHREFAMPGQQPCSEIGLEHGERPVSSAMRPMTARGRGVPAGVRPIGDRRGRSFRRGLAAYCLRSLFTRTRPCAGRRECDRPRSGLCRDVAGWFGQRKDLRRATLDR